MLRIVSAARLVDRVEARDRASNTVHLEVKEGTYGRRPSTRDVVERFGARIIGIVASDLRSPMYFAEGDCAQELFYEEAAAIQGRWSELKVKFRAALEKRAKPYVGILTRNISATSASAPSCTEAYRG
jgi:hypothetical protein